MTYQYSQALVDAKLNELQVIVSTSGVLKVFSGAEPANCAAGDPSGLLCTIGLPSTFMNAASGGVATMAGTWSANASGAGVAASWRIYDGSGTCHIQGNVSDMIFNNTNIASGQTVTVTEFTVTAGNYP